MDTSPTNRLGLVGFFLSLCVNRYIKFILVDLSQISLNIGTFFMELVR